MSESEIIQAEQIVENIAEATILPQENILARTEANSFKIWKVPMADFYTYDVFWRAINSKYEFHSTSCSWVALKEQ